MLVGGLLLAAGAGRRFGRPKALVDTGSGPWVLTSLDALTGCDQVCVVVGAAADQVTALLPLDVLVVSNPDHGDGMGSSLIAGLRACRSDVVLIMLVDLPDVTAAVVDRLLALARSAAAPRSLLARAAYRGVVGHPVLIGRDHFAGVINEAQGDHGALFYVRARPVELVDCGDMATGRDVDRRRVGTDVPPGLPSADDQSGSSAASA